MGGPFFMRKFYLDFETRSGADLKEEGADRHLSHPWADVWCMAYAVGDNPVQVLPAANIPSLFTASLLIDVQFVAHNAQFEWQVWNKILVKRYGLPPIGIDRFDCTMARGYSMGLPGSLDNMSAALGLQQGKDMAGSRLAVQMASPRTNKEGSVMLDASGNPIWWDDPEKRGRLYAYCKQDVEVERAIDRRVVPLTPNEYRVWCLDAAINQRGVCVDMSAIETAREIVEHEGSKDLNKLFLLTDGAVEGPTQVKRLTDWIQKQGVEIPGLNKQVVIDYLDDPEVPAAVAEVLRIRQDFAKTSTAKLNRMHGSASSDHRLRGLFAFGATGTGRFAGRIAQPQNLPRPTISQDEIETIIEFLKTHDAHESIAYLTVFHGKPMAMISNCLRGMLCAGPGLQLNAGDFANIEGRVLCWLAGEEWKLQAFRDYDAGSGTDIYLLAASRIYNQPAGAFTKKSPERQIGKVAELALGYQGGVGAFQTMAPNYGVKIPDEQAEQIKVAWRALHPRIKQYWYDLENAAIEAVEYPGSILTVGPESARVRFKKDGSFLWGLLPSGRALCYPYPELKQIMTPWGQEKYQLRYKTVEDQTKQWTFTDTYGGKLAENITQAVARDLLVEAMQRVDAAGLPIVLHVHDEIVTESSTDTLDELVRLMRIVPHWAAGLPIAVEGWSGFRYRK